MWHIKRFSQIARKSGIKSAVQSFLQYYDLLNAIRFGDLRFKLACDIRRPLPYTTHIGHPVGIVIASSAEIGENVAINQNVTIGVKDGGYPTICDNVRIWSGAVIVGDVRVGENAVVGANAVVIDDVPDGATVVGVPAKEVR